MNDADRRSAALDLARLDEIRPGVYAWTQPDGSWWINNAGAVVGDDGALVIDTCATATRTRRFLDALAGATDDTSIRWAVNTHQHGDHTYGNSLLPAATVLIGHEHMREGLRVDPVIDGCPPFWDPVPDWGVSRRRLPDITVSDASTVHVGSRRVELLHPGGPAHTTGDLIAWLPADRVLFAGDLGFSGVTPLVFMGSLTGALSVLDWLAAREPEVLVPGHGPVLTGADISRVLDEHRRYYTFVLRLADDGIARGRTRAGGRRAREPGSLRSVGGRRAAGAQPAPRLRRSRRLAARRGGRVRRCADVARPSDAHLRLIASPLIPSPSDPVSG